MANFPIHPDSVSGSDGIATDQTSRLVPLLSKTTATTAATHADTRPTTGPEPVLGKSRIDRRQVTIGDSQTRQRPTCLASNMLKKPLPNVFPLHLAPIDQFFRDDDTDKYPMCSVIQLDFTGRIERGAFETSLDQALERHALLRSHIRPAKRNLPCWVPAAKQLPWTDWGELNAPIELPEGERIDLTQDTGLRFWVRRGSDRSQVTFQVHHASTDGTGVYRFLGDLLAGYAALTGSDRPTAPAFSDLDPLLLRNRRRKMARIAHHDFTLPRFICHGLKRAWDVFGRTIEPLQVPGGQQPVDEPLVPFPGISTVVIDAAVHKRLRAAAKSYGSSLNDLMMAEMFRTIVAWNDSVGKDSGRNPWLRVMMPFDLREQDDYLMPAANMTSYTFVTRRLSECTNMKRLVGSIRDQTLRLKHQRAGTSFIDAIMLAAYAPAVLRYLLRRESCIATTCLSNIGDPSKRFTADLPRQQGRIVAGNLTLEDIRGVPPIRQQTHATLAVFSYLRKLTICVRCDPFLFTEPQARTFVEMYRDGLLSHA